MKGSLPDFVGIGAQKAGTTWTHAQLRRHSGLFLPEQKELNFFYQTHPESWYRKQFDGAGEGQLRGEISPNYFSQPCVAQRMHEMIPDARLFCILREPGERAYSQWKMARQLGNLPPDVPFVDALRANMRWMAEQGDYPARIAEFTQFYPSDRVLILFHDDMEEDPARFLETLLDWLGVTVEYDEALLSERVAASETASVVPPEHREEVTAYFADSVRRLEELTDRDLSHWLE